MENSGEVIGYKRKRSFKGLFVRSCVIAVAALVGAAVFLIRNDSSAKRSAPIDAGEQTFYKVGGTPGVDWQPFDQSYALGYINLGSSDQTRRCSSAVSTNSGKICKFPSGNNEKNPAHYVEYPGGAWYLGKKYDIREYVWSKRGGCKPEINLTTVRSWFPGSIARTCDAITMREWHFYPYGTLDAYINGTLAGSLEDAERRVTAGADQGFQGVMRLDDFDGEGEGYAIPIGNRGVWTVYNTQTAVKWVSGLGAYKWVGAGGSTDSSNPRTAIWVQFESSVNSPLTLAYFSTSHRSSISSDNFVVQYKIYGDIPQSIIDAINGLKDDLERRPGVGEGEDDGCDDSDDDDEDPSGFCGGDEDTDTSDDSSFIGDDDDEEDDRSAHANVPAPVWDDRTVKQFEITKYGLYDPYFYYQELINLLPEGYTFEGWFNREDEQLVDRDAGSTIVYGNRYYYGNIIKQTTPTPAPATCYSELH